MAERIVLVADDEKEIRDLFGLGLEKMGLKVLYAQAGDDAFEQIIENYVDIALIDLRMPGGGGEGLLQEIKSLPKDDRPVIVIITGHDDLTEEAAYIEGAQYYLRKPLSVKTVVKKIESILDRLEKAS